MPEFIKKESSEEIALLAAQRDALGRFQLKLGILDPSMPIEKQIQRLSKYHDMPDIESIKKGDTQLAEGYIKDFFMSQVEDFFISHPKAYELIGKKYDDILLDYAALGIKIRLNHYSSENDSNFRDKVIQAYYDYLTKYEQFLLNHIKCSGSYQLTLSSAEGLKAYIELDREHVDILNQAGGPMASGKLINEVMIRLFPKIKNLRDTGVSEYYFNRAVSDMIIGKFKAYEYFLMQMSKGGIKTLQSVLEPASEPLGMNGIHGKLSEVEEAFDLNEDQKMMISDLKSALESLQNNNTGKGNNTGCLGALMLCASATFGLLALMFIVF